MGIKEFGDYLDGSASSRPRKQMTMNNIDILQMSPDASPSNYNKQK